MLISDEGEGEEQCAEIKIKLTGNRNTVIYCLILECYVYSIDTHLWEQDNT